MDRQELAVAVRGAMHRLPHRPTAEEVLAALFVELENPHTCSSETDMPTDQPVCYICHRSL